MNMLSNKPELSSSLKTSTKMIMTSQMQKNISLLIPSVQEIQHEIIKEIENNPALEIVDEPVTSLDTIYANKHKNKDKKDYSEFLETLLTMPETLSDHLIWQLHMEDISNKYFEIGQAIIENLDENGFLIENPYVLCKQLLHATKQEVDEVLVIIQELDPVGCATKNIFNSLHTQLMYLEIDNAHKKQLNNCFNKIEALLKSGKHYNHKDIEKIMFDSLKDDEYKKYLYLLVPYPGIAYVHNHIDREVYVLPDAIIKNIDGKLIVKINQEIIPVLKINDAMQLAQKSKDVEACKLATTWIQSAESFINGLRYREYTLEKIISFIAHYQKEYFEGTSDYLKPLTRTELANALELNKSTISRLITNKYLQTDRGIFPLKFYFSQQSGNKKISGQHIKIKISEIIKYLESKQLKISDKIIADLLATKNITIARRTVAKYRKILEEPHG